MLSLSKFPPALAKRMPGSSRVYPTTRSPVPTNKPAPTGERAKDEVVVKEVNDKGIVIASPVGIESARTPPEDDAAPAQPQLVRFALPQLSKVDDKGVIFAPPDEIESVRTPPEDDAAPAQSQLVCLTLTQPS